MLLALFPLYSGKGKDACKREALKYTLKIAALCILSDTHYDWGKVSLVFHFKYHRGLQIGAFVNSPTNMHSEFSLREWQVKLGSLWFIWLPWSCTLWGITQNFTFIMAQFHIHAMSLSMKPYHIRIGGIHIFNGYTKSTFLLCAIQHLCHGVSVWHKASLVQSRSDFSFLIVQSLFYIKCWWTSYTQRGISMLWCSGLIAD